MPTGIQSQAAFNVGDNFKDEVNNKKKAGVVR